MTTPLSLVRLHPDMRQLAYWAGARGFLPRGADPGYALHAALAACLGDHAPKPFVLKTKAPLTSERPAEPLEPDRKNRSAQLLGYVSASTREVQESASLGMADGERVEAAAALRLTRLEASEMPPNWRSGRRLSFEIRLRPVVRSRRFARKPHGEIDAAQWAVQAAQADGIETPSHEDAYLNWAAVALTRSDALVLHDMRLKARRRTRLLLRTQPVKSAAADASRRVAKTVEGPDIIVAGRLEVRDGEAFARLLTAGVGRHKAFGFGCLLVGPPGVLG